MGRSQASGASRTPMVCRLNSVLVVSTHIALEEKRDEVQSPFAALAFDAAGVCAKEGHCA